MNRVSIPINIKHCGLLVASLPRFDHMNHLRNDREDQRHPLEKFEMTLASW